MRHHYATTLFLFHIYFTLAHAQIPLLRQRSTTLVDDSTLSEMIARVKTKYGADPGSSGSDGGSRKSGSGWISLETGQPVELGQVGPENKKKRQDDPGGKVTTSSIVNLEDDTSYFAPIGLGTPPKYYNVILDTGSRFVFESCSCVSKLKVTAVICGWHPNLAKAVAPSRRRLIPKDRVPLPTRNRPYLSDTALAASWVS